VARVLYRERFFVERVFVERVFVERVFVERVFVEIEASWRESSWRYRLRGENLTVERTLPWRKPRHGENLAVERTSPWREPRRGENLAVERNSSNGFIYTSVAIHFSSAPQVPSQQNDPPSSTRNSPPHGSNVTRREQAPFPLPKVSNGHFASR
jgi:hypothetical protein